MRLAIDGEHAVAVDDGGAVVDRTVGGPLGEPADDDARRSARTAVGPRVEHRVVRCQRSAGDLVVDWRTRSRTVASSGSTMTAAPASTAARATAATSISSHGCAAERRRHAGASCASTHDERSSTRLRSRERYEHGSGSSLRIWASTSNSLNSIQSSTMRPPWM